MDAPKSKALDSTLRLIFSLSQGILMVFCIILLYVILGETRMPSVWFLAGILTAVSFVVSFLLNTITQYLSCGKLNAVQLATTSAMPAGITGSVIILLSFIPFLESPITSVMPETLTPIYKKALSQGFYVFWAGLYGQLIASGFVQTCGGKA